MPIMRCVLFQSSLSSIPRCRRHTPQSSKSSWTRGFTSGSTAGVRFALLENKSLSKKLLKTQRFFQVEGTLCGFDPFMNLVLDDSIEFTKQVCRQYGQCYACYVTMLCTQTFVILYFVKYIIPVALF